MSSEKLFLGLGSHGDWLASFVKFEEWKLKRVKRKLCSRKNPREEIFIPPFYSCEITLMTTAVWDNFTHASVKISLNFCLLRHLSPELLGVSYLYPKIYQIAYKGISWTRLLIIILLIIVCKFSVCAESYRLFLQKLLVVLHR